MARTEPAANEAIALDLRALCGVARNKTLLRVDAADESRTSTLLEGEQDEADELFAAAVLHCCSGKFIVYCGVPTDRCSSAELFILRNPVGVVDGGVVDTVVIAGGEEGDGAVDLSGDADSTAPKVMYC
jgi:hypothetical protein